eukprot:GFYU01011386.1.p1 GENE.GFYU01011386.1~~GFYU01011386.1.p1  ORF type:complete len:517 (+),score=138.24 GFYU01011386.1:173-1723(+)
MLSTDTAVEKARTLRVARRQRRAAFLWSTSFFVLVIMVVAALNWYTGVADDLTTDHQNRKLLNSGGGDATCDTGFDAQPGAAVAYLVGMVYLFLGIAMICDDYFVGALEKICEALDLSEDVAGATFMAAGSSAPEFFTSVMGVFATQSNLGVGTIVGSAVFNLLIIIGVTAIAAGQVLTLDPRPFIRDSSWYAYSVLLLAVAFLDSYIYWWESMIFIASYVAYTYYMKYNARVNDFCLTFITPKGETKSSINPALLSVFRAGATAMILGKELKFEAEKSNDRPRNHTHHLRDVAKRVVVARQFVQTLGDHHTQGKISLPSLDFKVPETLPGKLMFALSLPYMILYKYTMPNLVEHPQRYIRSFAASIAWIAVLSYFMAEWATKLGCLLGIDPVVMGLTILAAGTSVPDALSSVLVAKDGYGDMAVSNAIGSNVFDVMICLGVPWLMSNIIYWKPVEVSNEGLGIYMLILFFLLGAIFSIIIFSRWRLFPAVGFMLFALYGLFVLYSLLSQFGVIPF